MPGEVAGEIEQRLAKAGHAVLSNSSTHRMDPDVPLIIAEVNPDHAKAIERQKANRGWSGYIVTNGNCSAIHLTLTLKPLQDAFGLDAVVVTTLQAVSGAGYPGVPSLDMIDNVVPFINTEEEKLAEEARKFLGVYDGEFKLADFVVSATCTRVPVRDGHTEAAVGPAQGIGHAGGSDRGVPLVPRQAAGDATAERADATRSSSGRRTTARNRCSTATSKKAWPRLSAACARARSWASSTCCSATTRSAARPARAS